jgi:hypothetical protein
VSSSLHSRLLANCVPLAIFSYCFKRELNVFSMTVGNGSQNVLAKQWHYEDLVNVFCQATYTWMLRLILEALHPIPPPLLTDIFSS